MSVNDPAVDQDDRFLRDVRRAVTMDSFCEQFATVAPKAWEALLELVPYANEWLGRMILDSREDDADADAATRARVELDRVALEWTTTYGLEGVRGFPNMAKVTLMRYALATFSNPDALPETLESPLHEVRFQDPVVRKVEGDWEVEADVIQRDITPSAETVVDLDLGDQVWNHFQESEAQFRTRMRQELDARLTVQIGTMTGTPSPRDVDAHPHWVRWFIEHRVNRTSINRIATTHGVDRKAVQKALPIIDGLLKQDEVES